MADPVLWPDGSTMLWPDGDTVVWPKAARKVKLFYEAPAVVLLFYTIPGEEP